MKRASDSPLSRLIYTVGKPKLLAGALAAQKRHLGQRFQIFGDRKTALWWREEPWDSQLFGKAVVKIEAVRGKNPIEIKKILRLWREKIVFSYAVIRLPLDEMLWIQAWEQAGAITLDNTIDFVLDPAKVEAQTSALVRQPQPQPHEWAEVVEIGNNFRFGRFFADPLFNKGKKAYREWIFNSLKGEAADKVWLLVKKGEIHGLVTSKYEKLGSLKLLSIPLVGKSAESQEKNVAKTILSSVVSYAKIQDYDGVTVSTQANNMAAVRAYLGVGFKPFNTSVTLRIEK